MFRFKLTDGKQYSIQFKYTKLVDEGKRLATATMDIYLPEEGKYYPVAKAHKSVHECAFSRYPVRKAALEKLIKNLKLTTEFSHEDSSIIWQSYIKMANGRW